MRVGVQHPGARRAGEQEAHEELAVVVALLLRPLADDRGQRRGALQPLGDQHLVADRDHVRDHDVGVVAERVRERPLRLRLEGVVELVLRAGLELLHQRPDLDAGDQRADRAGEPGELTEVGLEGLAGSGVLHLHRDVAAVTPAALVHLADARGRGRAAVEPDQVVPPVGTQVLLDLVAHRLRRHRRRGVLEPGQLRAVRRDHLVRQRGLEDRHRLAELHRPALELAERAEQLLGRPLLDLAHHRLGAPPAQPLAEPDRAAAGVPQGQRRKPRGPRDGLARELGHGSILPDPPIDPRAAAARADDRRAGRRAHPA